MVQTCKINIAGDANDTLLIHDDAQFERWAQEYASILAKAQHIAPTSLKVIKAEAEYNEYSIIVEAILDNKSPREGKMVLDYVDLLNIIGHDENGNLDLVYVKGKEKFELYKFLIKRLWDYYKYGKKFFKA